MPTEALATIVVAIISTLGVIATTVIQTIANNKKDNIDTKLTAMSVNFDNKLNTLQKNLTSEKLDRAKADLVGLMSRIRNGYVPTTEEKMILYETKKKYNDLGGDSYVDDMFEKLKKEGKL